MELRICAWNPNGIRSLFRDNPHEVKDLIARHGPDIIVWNETKGNENKLKETVDLCNVVLHGWSHIWNNSTVPGRYGTAISVRPELASAGWISLIGLGFDVQNEPSKEPEGRIITLELPSCIVVGIYAVNSGTQELKRLQYKIHWLEKLLHHIEQMKRTRPSKSVIVIGDLNIAPKDIDIHDPKKNQNSSGFTRPEREAFQVFVNRGWVDVYRLHNPKTTAYTFWSGKSKHGNRYGGWRIDHALIDFESISNVKDVQILSEYMGSDHCPIMLTYQMGGIIVNPNIRFHFPVVVRLKRSGGQIVQGCDIHITRKFSMGGWNLPESIWHNPYKVSDDEERSDTLDKYEVYIRDRIGREWNVFEPLIREMLTRGRCIELGCFCKPEPCHGDVIVKIAAEYAMEVARQKTDSGLNSN